jgi:hypothetical protein
LSHYLNPRRSFYFYGKAVLAPFRLDLYDRIGLNSVFWESEAGLAGHDFADQPSRESKCVQGMVDKLELVGLRRHDNDPVQFFQLYMIHEQV